MRRCGPHVSIRGGHQLQHPQGRLSLDVPGGVVRPAQRVGEAARLARAGLPSRGEVQGRDGRGARVSTGCDAARRETPHGEQVPQRANEGQVCVEMGSL